MVHEFSGNSPSLNARNLLRKSNISNLVISSFKYQRISSPAQPIPLSREGYGCKDQHTALLLYCRQRQKLAGITINTDEVRRPVRIQTAHKQVRSQRDSLCLSPHVRGCWRVTNVCALASWTDNQGIPPDRGWESKSAFVGMGKTPRAESCTYQYCQQCL